MNLINLVYDSLKLKKSDAFCAEKIGISLEKYQAIKQQILDVKYLVQDDLDDILKDLVSKKINMLIDDETILQNYIGSLEDQLTEALTQQKEEKVLEWKEDLEDGTAEIKGIAFSEPKSPEEIIKILKIDTKKWKLSSYWNKQHKDYWLISAMVSHKKLDENELLRTTLENFKPNYNPVQVPILNNKYETPRVGVLSIQDLHFGKENNESIVKDFENAVKDLIHRSYACHLLDEVVYVIGGDLLNMDTFDGSTTKGTVVENSMRAQEAYNLAFESLFWSVNYISQFCNKLKIIYLPGNHDRLSSYHLAHALSKCFNSPNIEFNVEYAERKVIVCGQNFFGFEHGDISSKNSLLLYATEFSKEWGSTRYRTVYTGHFHTKKTVEYKTENEVHGFAVKHMPSLCKSDYWHYHNKYTGSKRQAIMEVHDLFKGKVCEFIHTA